MRAYSIFDDFGEEPVSVLAKKGISIDVHPKGKPRPGDVEMKRILEEYDCIIIGTSQKITEEMFDAVTSPRIIATASVGLDHIHIPDKKKELVRIINTPKANAQSVAEYTIGCALTCCKRLIEGRDTYYQGKDNKTLSKKPEDLFGKTLGVIGAGNVSQKVMEYGLMLGMNVLCWTAHPEKHMDLTEKRIRFVSLEAAVTEADVISVNLPDNKGTNHIISESCVEMMKDSTVFISVSRRATVDVDALFNKAKRIKDFYVCLDLDVDDTIVGKVPKIPNVIVTPHIAGGTIETRKRMFLELAHQIMM